MKNFLFILLRFQNALTAQKPQLFLLAGQSNAVGQGDSLKSMVCLPNTAFEFDAAGNRFVGSLHIVEGK